MEEEVEKTGGLGISFQMRRPRSIYSGGRFKSRFAGSLSLLPRFKVVYKNRPIETRICLGEKPESEAMRPINRGLS
jgi:hypothetical protein